MFVALLETDVKQKIPLLRTVFWLYSVTGNRRWKTATKGLLKSEGGENSNSKIIQFTFACEL